MWLSSFVLFLQSLPHAGPTGSLKPLGLLVGEQEHPFPPTQCEPQRGGQKQGGEAIPNSSGAAAQGTGARRFQLCHTAPASPCPHCHMGPVAAGQEPSKEQCGSGPGAAPALQALRQGVTLRWPVAHWEQEKHGEKITHFNKEMCSEREALRSCQKEHRQREQSPGCLRPQLPPSPGSS